MARSPLFHCFHDEVMHLHFGTERQGIPLQLIFPVRMQIEDGRIRPAFHWSSSRRDCL